MSSEAAVEQELAAACARGEGRAWCELVRRYGRDVRGVLRGVVPDVEADDLRQEVWAHLLTKDGAALRRFRARRAGGLQLFLRQVARGVAACHGRRARVP